MKEFPIHVLSPLSGTFNAVIFENSFIGLSKSLFFKMDIPLEPIDMASIGAENEIHQTSFRFDHIKLTVKSLKELENKTFNFPINPKEGYIDGSMYLFDVHNIVDVIEIKFGAFDKQMIEVNFMARIDFEHEGTGYLMKDYVNFETKLALGELVLSADIINPIDKNLETAKTLAQQFIDIEHFSKAYLGEMGVSFHMKVEQ